MRSALAAYGLPATRGGRISPFQIGFSAAQRRAAAEAKRAELRAFKLHWGQTQAWMARDAGYQIISMFAGSGGGKTWYGPRHWLPVLRAKPGATFLFIEPTYRMLKRAMLPKVLELYNAFDLGRMNKGDMVYELHSGGHVYFCSIDDPNAIQGIHPDGGIWCDEIGLYSEEAWDVIQQRAGLHETPILNTSTPYTLPWCERRLARKADREISPAGARAQHPFLVQFGSYVNEAYPRKQFLEFKKQWPKDKFDRIMRGLFTKIGGLVFDEFNEIRNLATIRPLGDGTRRILFRHPVEGERIIDLVRVWAAQDWGWLPDPGVQLLFGEDAYGRMYVFEEDYETKVPVERGTGTGNDTWVRRALNRNERWGLDAIYCDPSRPSDIDDFVKWGLPAVGAVNRIDAGIDAVNTAFHVRSDGTCGLYIAQNACPNLVRTIGIYVRKRRPGGDGYLDKPADYQDDHAEDGLRYGVIGDRELHGDGGLGFAPQIIIGTRRNGQ